MSCPLHVDGTHDCTGADMRCPCGYKPMFPPISVSITVFNRRLELVNEAFSCETVDAAIDALREAADKLERES